MAKLFKPPLVLTLTMYCENDKCIFIARVHYDTVDTASIFNKKGQ